MSTALDTVLPLVRASSQGAGHGEVPPPAGEAARLVATPLAGALIVLYAFDRDDGFRLVAHCDLDRLGVDLPTLAGAAQDNLLDRLDQLQILERPDGCGMVRVDGNLEASVLLVPQLWHDVEQILGDDVLVAVPACDVVLFCAAGNATTRTALRSARDRALAVGSDALSADLFRFSADAWHVEPA